MGAQYRPSAHRVIERILEGSVVSFSSEARIRRCQNSTAASVVDGKPLPLKFQDKQAIATPHRGSSRTCYNPVRLRLAARVHLSLSSLLSCCNACFHPLTLRPDVIWFHMSTERKGLFATRTRVNRDEDITGGSVPEPSVRNCSKGPRRYNYRRWNLAE